MFLLLLHQYEGTLYGLLNSKCTIDKKNQFIVIRLESAFQNAWKYASYTKQNTLSVARYDLKNFCLQNYKKI